MDGRRRGSRGSGSAALRRRYAAKFADPAAWKRLLGGAIDLRKLATGLRQAAATAPKSALAEQMREGLAQFGGPVDILLAERDRTAQLFTAAWGDDGTHCPPRQRLAQLRGSGRARMVAEARARRTRLNDYSAACTIRWAANSRSATKRSASSAAMQPVPAAVTAWR
ncbi:hypothetical protein [Novosphingobium sp. Gsoil 351]|uniref:hypothetical protein n=1 Tax=Novosphingobium sp. Gsoil 351 TaxID=2675225 RepID=UPI00351BA9BE